MKFLYLPLVIALVVSCSSSNNKSDAFGNFEANETIVSAENAGRITQLTIETGDILTAGQSIGKIDSTQTYLKLSQLQAARQAVLAKAAAMEAQVLAAQTLVNTATKSFDRANKMLIDSAITQQNYDELNGKLEGAKAQLKAAQMQVSATYSEIEVIDTQIDQAKDMLRKCSIVNPIDGTILERFADKGELVGPGVPIYKIADLKTLNLRAYISGAMLNKINLNDSVEVKIDKDKNEFTSLTGVVTWISSQAEFTPKIIQTKEERVNMVYAIKIKVINDGSLKIGMPGEVKFK